MRLALALSLLTPIVLAAAPTITLQVSTETAPPGGFAQFKIFVASPALISSANISMTLDPSIFGPITTAAAFSSTGDQTGTADLQGQTVNANFTSMSAGIGQLPALPVFVVTVPILPTAKTGATASISVDGTQRPWLDGQGNAFTINVTPGTFTVGGTLSIEDVAPGGGLLPAGTSVAITGTGFDAATLILIDGVSIASTKLISPQEIDVTLGGATEIYGKCVHVSNTTGAEDYFVAWTIQATDGLILPQLPSPSYTAVNWRYPISTGMVIYFSCLQNPNAFPVTATYYYLDSSGSVTTYPAVTIPPHDLYVADNQSYEHGLGVIFMTVSAPIRMAEFRQAFYTGATESTAATVYPPAQATRAPGTLSIGTQNIIWNWQIGTIPPNPQTVGVGSGFPFTVSISNGATEWLQITQKTLTPGETNLTLTPLVSLLGAGTYTGTVTITQQFPPGFAQFSTGVASFPVMLTISAQPIPAIAITTGSFAFTAVQAGIPSAPQTIQVTSNGAPASFTTTVTGGAWLTATPSSGTTPATITLTANSSGLAVGVYQSTLTIQGPGNATQIVTQLTISSASPGRLNVFPTALAFSIMPGTQTLNQTIGTQPPISGARVSVSTQSGDNWLTASENDQFVDVAMTSEASSLANGIYQGSVTIASPNLNLSATVPVTLIVGPLPGTTQLDVTPSTLTLSAPAGTTATTTLNVNLVSGAPYFTLQRLESNQLVISVLPLDVPPAYTSPSLYLAPITFQIQATAQQPGTYQGSIALSWAGGSTTIPVTYYATASSTPPTMTAITNSGSETPGSLAPGELISIFGSALGGAPASLQLSSNSTIATNLAGIQVLIDGSPAPMLYSSTGQVNAIVPYEVGTTGTTSVQVVAYGIQSSAWTVPLAPSSPSTFTTTASGVGQGAIVNQDGSINSASNPASRGTVIQIYATGGGQTSPYSSTGGVALAAANLALPATVTIGGSAAQVIYAGSAPGEVNGVVQINVMVPQYITPGTALPLVVSIAGVVSQIGVTVAVQ